MVSIAEAFAPLDDQTRRSRTASDDPWRPILPVPADAPPLPPPFVRRSIPAGYTATAEWLYCDRAGALLGAVVRADRPANGLPADKQFRPFTFCEGPGGRREWRCKGFTDPRPLYGLLELAQRPLAPVIVTEGEKSADAGRKLFQGHVVITSPNGSKSADKADWSPLAGRDVVIWPDADEPGARYAEAVADVARQAGARSVRIVALPGSLPAGWDLADELPAGVASADLPGWLNEAAAAPTDGPLPLFPPLPQAEPYPLAALGPTLSRAAAAIAGKVQVPEAIAAQSVLSAAALAAQAHADVMLPYGQTRPLSLFFVTVAASGDRKSTADNEALWPIGKREKTLRDDHKRETSSWRIVQGAWAAEKKKVETNAKIGFDERKERLAHLGEEPPRPLAPFLTSGDLTIEGLTKAWGDAHAALGVFTAEAGQFTGGHGMNEDNRLKTAAMLSELWDGKPIKRIRSLDGVSILPGRRLSMHLLIQPDAAIGFLANSTLRDQGLLSRVLAAAPDSVAGSGLYRDTSPDDERSIAAYGARLLAILEAPATMAEGSRNELEPRALTISAEAAKLWRAFYDHIERQCGPGRDLRAIQDFAAKAAEHAARIAGVLTIVDDVHATEIKAPAMANALTLADWYVNEAVRLQHGARTDARLLRAAGLLEWMQGRGTATVSFREIVQFGPGALRTKAAAEEAVTILIAHHWITEASARPRAFRVAAQGGLQ